jgi:hypothetical protein
MKKFILGLITGALLFSMIPIYATVQEYILQQSDCKLVIDGNEFNAELPVLNMEGYNYLPAAAFREICDKLNIGFEFDNTTKEIRVNTKKKAEEVEPVKEDNTVSEANDNKPYLAPNLYRGHRSYINIQYAPTREENGITIYVLDNIGYINIHEIEKYKLYPMWKYDEKRDYAYIEIYNQNSELLISDTPFIDCFGLNGGQVFIEYDYYKNTIMQLANEGAN